MRQRFGARWPVWRWGAAGFVALAFGLPASRASALDRRDQALIDARPSADAAVVALLGPGGELLCSGSVIRPDVVLTAAHCIEPGAELPSLLVAGPDIGAARPLAVIRWLRHPGYAPATLEADLGLVGLDGPLDVAPLEVAAEPIESGYPGAAVRVAGFGCTSLADAGLGVGVRRTRDDVLALEQPTPGKLRHGDATCLGDSGGPLLYRFPDTAERLIGLSSSGGERAGTPFSVAIELAPHAGWIQVEADRLEAELTPPPAQAAQACGVGTRSRDHTAWLIFVVGVALARVRRATLCHQATLRAPRMNAHP